MKTKYLIIIFVSVITACTSLKETEEIKILAIEPKIDMIVDNGMYFFNFTFISESDDSVKIRLLNKIEKIKVDIIDQRGKNLKTTETTSFKKSGIYFPKANAKVICFTSLMTEEIKFTDSENFSIKYTVFYNDYTDSQTKPLNSLKNESSYQTLDIYPIINKKDENVINLGLFTIRKKVIEEYIPNSELLRIKVINDKGKLVFRSDEGGNFMQIIYPVYPEEVGKSYIYSYTWKLENKNRFSIPSGKYDINIMIPALPNPYSTDIKLEWDGK
jgi:hypothetical protein